MDGLPKIISAMLLDQSFYITNEGILILTGLNIPNARSASGFARVSLSIHSCVASQFLAKCTIHVLPPRFMLSLQFHFI